MRMTGVLVKEIGKFEFGELPLSGPQANEVTVKVAVTGLCRTDLKIIRAGHRDLVLPRVPGEEVVGTVHAVGAKVNQIKLGELVYVYPGIWCGKCSACRQGAENLCRKMRIMGFHRDGGFAEYVNVPVQSLIPVPLGLDAEQAVFAEPLSCCLNALELARLAPGERVAIWGAGPAGTLLARASSAMGAEPVSIEPDDRRRALIGGHAQCPHESFDVGIVAVGARAAYQQALGCIGARGRIVVFSGLLPHEAALEVNFNQLHYYEQTVVGAYGCSYRHGQLALELIASGKLTVADMISHRMPLSDLQQALNLVETRQGMKILLYPS